MSPRIYKPAWTPDEAETFIIEGAGTMFDPELVRVFKEVRHT